jgi:hypothetical protein
MASVFQVTKSMKQDDAVIVIGVLSTLLAAAITTIVCLAVANSRLRPKIKLVVLAMCKNEGRIMREWLRHYRNEGVAHFVIIDNGSTDGTVDILRAQPDVTLVEDHAKHAQQTLYNKYFDMHIRGEYDWVVVVDLDEFIYARRYDQTIQSMVARVGAHVGSICVPWKMFGSSGHVAHPPGRVVDAFQWRMRPITPHKREVKSILRVKAVKNIEVHDSELYSKFIYVDAGLLPCDKNWGQETSEDDYQNHVLALNHYAIQSEEYFREVKMTRGDVSSDQFENVRDMKYFGDYDHKDVIDTELADKR